VETREMRRRNVESVTKNMTYALFEINYYYRNVPPDDFIMGPLDPVVRTN